MDHTTNTADTVDTVLGFLFATGTRVYDQSLVCDFSLHNANRKSLPNNVFPLLSAASFPLGHKMVCYLPTVY